MHCAIDDPVTEIVDYFYGIAPLCPYCDAAIASWIRGNFPVRCGDMLRDDDNESTSPSTAGSSKEEEVQLSETVDDSVPWDYSNPPVPSDSSSSSSSSSSTSWFRDCFNSVKKTVSDTVSMPTAVKDTSAKVSSFADEAKKHFSKVETDVHEALEVLKTKLNSLPSFDKIVDTVKNSLAKTFSFLSSFKFWAVCGCVAFLILLAITKDPKFQAVVMATASLYIAIVGLTISVNTAIS